MTRIEELEARIRELEKENDTLRGKKKMFTPTIPKQIEEKFENTDNVYDAKRFYAITVAVRQMCFPPIAGKRRNAQTGKKMPCDFTLRVMDMTPEQYKRYVDILDEVADILAAYEYVE